MGRPARLIISHCHKHAKANATCLQQQERLSDGQKYTFWPIPLPHSGPWNTRLMTRKRSRKNQIRLWDSETPGLIISPITHQSLIEWLKIVYIVVGDGTFKCCNTNPAEITWLINIRGSANQPGFAQTELLRIVEGHKVPIVCISDSLRKCVLFLGKRQTHSWDCFCSRTWLHLVHNAKTWGNPMCTSRRFNLGWK